MPGHADTGVAFSPPLASAHGVWALLRDGVSALGW